MRFIFPHSHAFPRGKVTVKEAEDEPGCLVEFGDGETVIAEWRRMQNGIRLDIPSYCTAKGTQIGAKSWLLVEGKDGDWRTELMS